MGVAQYLCSFDQKDEAWDGRLGEKVTRPFVLHVLGNRFDIILIPRDSSNEAVKQWFASLVGAKPVIVSSMPGAIVVCNSRNIAVFELPAPAALLETIRGLPKVHAINPWADGGAKNVVKATTRPDVVEAIKGGAENSVAFLGRKDLPAGTLQWVLNVVIDVLAVDLGGNLDPEGRCSECGQMVNLAQLAAHYLASHLDATKCAREVGDGLWLCGVCGAERCAREDLVPHLAVAHESRIIEWIVRQMPGAAAVFGVSASGAPIGIDATGAVDAENAAFWRHLRLAERGMSARRVPDGANIAQLLLQIDRSRRDLRGVRGGGSAVSGAA